VKLIKGLNTLLFQRNAKSDVGTDQNLRVTTQLQHLLVPQPD